MAYLCERRLVQHPDVVFPAYGLFRVGDRAEFHFAALNIIRELLAGNHADTLSAEPALHFDGTLQQRGGDGLRIGVGLDIEFRAQHLDLQIPGPNDKRMFFVVCHVEIGFSRQEYLAGPAGEFFGIDQLCAAVERKLRAVGKRQVLHLFPCVVADEHFGCGTQGGRQPAGSEENDHERCRGQPDAVGFGVVALRPSLIDCVGVDARHQAREGIPCAVTLVCTRTFYLNTGE